jgi:hypothetical protein
MADVNEDYRSYLLRLWRVQADGHAWRASLENVQTREVRSFASMQEFFAYLRLSMDLGRKDAEDQPEC